MRMPDVIDESGNLWMHAREGAVIQMSAFDPAQDASAWTVVFRTESGFFKPMTVDGSAPKTLRLDLSVADGKHFPLLTVGQSADAGEPFALMDETTTPPRMIMQGYACRYGFE